jgi:hypothetical protein
MAVIFALGYITIVTLVSFLSMKIWQGFLPDRKIENFENDLFVTLVEDNT